MQCDLQRPKCTRCRKARIPCIGPGEQRYKFINRSQHRRESCPAPVEGPPQSSRPFPPTFDFSVPPSSESSILAQSLVAHLALKDLRYSITQLWGPFLADLPRRMGCNEALDAATATVLGLHDAETRFVRDSATLRPVLRQYVRAINAVRSILDDPVRAQEVETLCAVFLLAKASCYFPGPISNFISPHGTGAVELLKLRGFRRDQGPFESMLYGNLRFQVAQEMLFDPDPKLSRDQWKMFETSCPNNQFSDHLLRCTVRVGRFLTEVRSTARGSIEEVAAYYRVTQFQGEVEQITLGMQREVTVSTHGGTEELALKQKYYNRGLVITAVLLCVQRALAPKESRFAHEIDLLCSRVYQLAEDARAYLPLGGNWMLIGLMVIWCAAKGTAHQSRIENLLDGWRRDTLPEEHARVPHTQLEEMYQRLSFEERHA
ncbi:hypothetical protein AYO21_02670 [Fonsecaea monophora]|uniref:Zn(2)-C6 fungal-type domain-containing protein n=1 Tax=Fonsecaea monophora TaxID=254056 RepID=A0A177FH55_9EURO|nr:hypothetical protein AYO21_02670 [Fonsecaea monophora]OAG43051.1 hypothetical protein AYO21_02670 [Fonsecaea monophora]